MTFDSRGELRPENREPHPREEFHVADDAASDRVTSTIALAFSADPNWSPLLGADPDDLGPAHRYWELFVRSARRYPWSYANRDCTAASVWYPPRAEELASEEESRFPRFVSELFGSAAAQELLETVDRFGAARPHGDYFYLSLLAVHPSRRGEGLGMRLLAENLGEIDSLGLPSYLESSNPANDAKYERLGYRRHGNIDLPSGLLITTFWREPYRA